MNTTGLIWRKSSYSNNEGGACLEIAPTPTTIHIRDSKHLPTPDAATPTLTVTPATWTAFLQCT
ncbi:MULTISPECIES: DUF397 domain-containing protein [Streptomyces]|uniref:DUF397 domain-containing protein n=1 Tax=Streptomyces TaxID=1883 RepID=UPI00292EAA9F|nr:DUF397 domain-containing protein [Streptomyces sp. NEAU-HV9]